MQQMRLHISLMSCIAVAMLLAGCSGDSSPIPPTYAETTTSLRTVCYPTPDDAPLPHDVNKLVIAYQVRSALDEHLPGLSSEDALDQFAECAFLPAVNPISAADRHGCYTDATDPDGIPRGVNRYAWGLLKAGAGAEDLHAPCIYAPALKPTAEMPTDDTFAQIEDIADSLLAVTSSVAPNDDAADPPERGAREEQQPSSNEALAAHLAAISQQLDALRADVLSRDAPE